MLAPDERSILRELLRPPLGCQLDLAVTTTFTLDLTSALVAPLAFASYRVDGAGDPVAVLEAVRSAADRVTVFCQAGHIRVPRTASDLVAFLEPMVYEVAALNPGYLFHPKVWILRFVDQEGLPTYRLLCGTRNLTGDVSWDAVVALDGWIESYHPQAVNRPLAELIRALPLMSLRPVEASRRRAIEELAEELMTVRWEFPPNMNDVHFHALGIGIKGAQQRLEKAVAGRRTVVVSPFLDDATVEWFWDNTGELVVVSRIESLERLQPETQDELLCRVLDPLASLDQADEPATATDGSTTEQAVDDETAAGQPGLLGGLHAKIYVAEDGAKTRLVIGSANATSAGLDDHNVEFLVEFACHRKHAGFDVMLNTAGEFGSMLNQYEPTGGVTADPSTDALRELQNQLRRCAQHRFRADVEPAEDGWRESVSSAKPIDIDADVRLTFGLLTMPGSVVEYQAGPVNAAFHVPATADITPFLVLRLAQQVAGQWLECGTIVRADLHGDPDGRLDEVLARQVNTPEKFLRFLMLLLSLRDSPPLPGDEGVGDGASWMFGAAGRQGIFEMVVRALADQPAAIDDLDRLVTRLRSTESGAAVLPPGFAELWDVVVGARTALGAAP